MVVFLIKKYNNCLSWNTSFKQITIEACNSIFKVLPLYYKLTDFLWYDGFIIDFLQKKFIDKWVRYFVITSANIFNERLLFNFVIKFYIDSILWPQNIFTSFDVQNIASMLTIIWVTISFLIIIFNLHLLFSLIIMN